MADERRTGASPDRRDGEPRGAASRLTGEMQVPGADHVRHDPLLVASLLDRSTGGAERDRAEALVADCIDCAALHQDLVTLRDATRTLPTPPRPRSYTLSAEDAARLQRTGWRRLVAMFGSTRDAFSRPLAIGLTTIGLAGLLVATVPGSLSFGGESTAGVPTLGQAADGAGANSEALQGSKVAPAASAAPSAFAVGRAPLAPSEPTTAPAPASAEPAPSAESPGTFVGAPAASAGAAALAPQSFDAAQRDGADTTVAESIGEPGTAPTARLAVLVLAGLLLAAGLGLFALRWAGRRI